MKINKLFDFFKKEKKKPVIICIHGFGKRRSDEFSNLVEALKEEELILPKLFDQRFPEDSNWFNWVSKAEEKLIQAKNEKREIILIGFSMGGVIASYLASKFEVKKLILLAPAFEYLTPTTAKMTIKNAITKTKKVEVKEYVELPSHFTNTFLDVVNNCKKGIEKISCPVLFIHCMEDEVIDYNVSLKYYKKVPHDNKRCIILADGQHRILDDERLKDSVISIIQEEIKK